MTAFRLTHLNQVLRQSAANSTICALTLVAALTLPASAGSPSQIAPQPSPEAVLKLGNMLVLQRCSNCHALEPGEDRYAAPLHDLFGRSPGSLEGFTYSENMKGINTPWTPSTLDNWLAQTTFDTPDIRMRHTGIENHVHRKAVIAYLKTLPGNAKK